MNVDFLINELKYFYKELTAHHFTWNEEAYKFLLTSQYFNEFRNDFPKNNVIFFLLRSNYIDGFNDFLVTNEKLSQQIKNLSSKFNLLKPYLYYFQIDWYASSELKSNLTPFDTLDELMNEFAKLNNYLNLWDSLDEFIKLTVWDSLDEFLNLNNPATKLLALDVVIKKIQKIIHKLELEFRLSHEKRPSRAELIRDLAKV